MCDMLVILYHLSNVCGEMAVGIGTFEATGFVIIPHMVGQNFS